MFEMIPQGVDIEDITIIIITPEDLKIYAQAIDVEGCQVESDLPGIRELGQTIMQALRKQICGHRIDDRYKVTSDTKNILKTSSSGHLLF